MKIKWIGLPVVRHPVVRHCVQEYQTAGASALLAMPSAYLAPFCMKIDEKLSGCFRGLGPLTPARGSVPGPRWGLCPQRAQTSVIGSRSTRLLCPPLAKHGSAPGSP